MENIQRSLTEGVERYLAGHPAALDLEPGPRRAEAADHQGLFLESPPELGAPPAPQPDHLRRLLRKYDPVERDFRNRQLGNGGESLVFEFERERLKREGRPDLSRRVRWVAQEDGDGAGYDIRSYSATDGSERWIEVKTTRGPQRSPFLITRNECAVAEERPDAFRLYRVYEFGETPPKLFKLKPPLEAAVVLRPETYEARFG